MAKKRRNPKRSVTRKQLPYRVFISRATHDKWIAKILCEKFEAAGAKTFRDDRDIQGGDSIPDVILSEIRSCDEVVVLLTPESVQRQWVLIEIGIAIGVKRRIIPLMYHIDPKQLPAIIRDNRGFSLNDLDDYIADVTKRIKNQ
ncbi:MAG: toll/interleukin-1 receptor domain-containing protein [Planctomycetes bacterium]|nr:toll/interleukin-1 receptor domain-containing protein [Planctomycetota bacterium]